MTRKYRPISVLVFCSLSILFEFRATADVSKELKETISGLSDLRENIRSSSKVSHEPGLGIQSIEAERAFARAGESMVQMQWLTVLQETQRYLEFSQRPDPQTWMKAQYMLGRAYDERGQAGRAARAYLRYLSTFITSKSTTYSDMTEVLERLVRVSTKGSGHAKAELRQFLSSISAMKVPSDIEPELRYFIALGSSNIGQKNLALTWLNDLDTKASAPEARARANLLKALIAMQESNWELAEDSLQAVLAADGLKKNTYDSARLSLARVYLKLRKPLTALKIYETISKDSESYRDALFERVFANIRQNNGDIARTLTREYLEKYADHPDALQIRTLQSWLELNSGDLVAAKSAINAVQKGLEDLREKVTDNLSGRSVFTQNDAATLLELTSGQVSIPPDLQDILSMFEQMNDLDIRLAEVNGMALNSLYTIAKIDLNHYLPALGNRIQQVSDLVKTHMTVTERFIGLEKNRLASLLTSVDSQKLTAGARRRTALFSKEVQLSMDAKRLVTWLGPAEQLASLAKSWKRQESIAADSTNQTQGAEDRLRAGVNLRAQMLNTLTEIRTAQASQLVDQSKLKEVQYQFEQFSTLVIDDQVLLGNYEPNQTQTLDLIDDDDSQTAWSLLSLNTSLLHQAIVDLRTDAESHLQRNLASIGEILSRKNKLSADLVNIKDVLEKKAAGTAPALLAHFDSVIGQRIARQQKWSGDVEFMSYMDKTESHKTLRKAHDLELQILSDNLRDQVPGGRQWPR